MEVGGGELINRNTPYGGSDLLTSSIMYTRLPRIEEAGSIMQARRQPRRTMAVVDGDGAHGVLLGGRGGGLAWAPRGALESKGKSTLPNMNFLENCFKTHEYPAPLLGLHARTW